MQKIPFVPPQFTRQCWLLSPVASKAALGCRVTAGWAVVDKVLDVWAFSHPTSVLVQEYCGLHSASVTLLRQMGPGDRQCLIKS